MSLANLFSHLPVEPLALAGTMLIIFLSAVLRGVTGFGFAIAAVPLLSFFFAPVVAVTTVILLQMMSGVVDVPAMRRECDWVSVKWLTLGALAGSPVGVLLLSVAPVAAAQIAIGSISLAAALSFSRGMVFNLPPRGFGLGAGFAAGLFNGLAAMPGPPVVAYYLSMGTKRLVMRASLLIFFVSTSVIASGVAAAMGLISEDSIAISLFSFPAMVFGGMAGVWLSRFGSDAFHKMLAIAVLAAIAVASILNGVLALRGA